MCLIQVPSATRLTAQVGACFNVSCFLVSTLHVNIGGSHVCGQGAGHECQRDRESR